MGLFYMKKFDQYVRHLQVLCRAEQEDLTNEFIVSGIIDKFYIQFELGWKVLKELLRYEGANQAAMGSPREIIKTAYAYFHFMEEDVWLEMLRDRNDATHIYIEEAAQSNCHSPTLRCRSWRNLFYTLCGQHLHLHQNVQVH